MPHMYQFGFQLGHVFSDMEICGGILMYKVVVGLNDVSIGPRLFRHGNEKIKELVDKEIESGFNWATSFQTWKYHYGDKDYLDAQRVSIGPRLFRHGNRAYFGPLLASGFFLICEHLPF